MALYSFDMMKTFYLQISKKNVREKKSTMENPNAQKLNVQKSSKREWNIVWESLISISYFHIAAIYGVYLFFASTMFYTFLWSLLIGMLGEMGITAGVHRLWAHRTYEAKWPLRLLLMICQTIAFQRPIFDWARDHRVHHKFTDTDADPHTTTRGFFFTHVGWLLVRKHPDVIKKGESIDVSDLEQDPIVTWQRRWYFILMPLCCFIIPTWIPVHFWGEKLWNSWYSSLFRHALSLNKTWLVNSAAHMWGMKPYDSTITPTQNLTVSILMFGEGWHNYHHVFPWDYKADELGNYGANFTTALIDFCGKLGLAYNMKTVPTELVKKRAFKSGDGSIYQKCNGHMHNGDNLNWGWGDTSMEPEDIKNAEILHGNK